MGSLLMMIDPITGREACAKGGGFVGASAPSQKPWNVQLLLLLQQQEQQMEAYIPMIIIIIVP